MQRRKQDVSHDWKSSSRGDRAWKEVVEDLAARNADVRKAGRSEREAYERARQDVRRAAAAKRHTRLLGRRTP